jgi:shikimate kinase
MEELTKLRDDIDECDKALVEFFLKRLSLVDQLLEVKCRYGQSIFDPEREKKILEKAKSHIEDTRAVPEALDFLKQILKISRKYQSGKLFPYNIVLTGFMGSGKTSVGRELAGILEMGYEDCDVLIEKEAGMTINEIFATRGESHFRLLEKEMIKRLSQLSNTIVICGGGAVMNPENVKALKSNGILVFLKATPENIYDRIRNDTNRPVLNGKMNIEGITSLYQQRMPAYLSTADIIIDSNGSCLERISGEIINRLCRIKNPLFSREIRCPTGT